jgi:hypothetical protein
MQTPDAPLGIRSIPKQFRPLFSDKDLPQALAEARAMVSETPSAWEVVEEPSGNGGFQTLDVPFKSVPVKLSEEEEKLGRRRMAEAYKTIDLVLEQMDRRIAQLEHSVLRRLLILTGLVLVLSGVAILAIGVFRHSEIKLTGKDGAASLLLGAGLPILASMYAKDRKLRTLPSRVRARLAFCLAHPDYTAVRECFMRALEQVDSAFGQIQRRVAAEPNAEKDIDL